MLSADSDENNEAGDERVAVVNAEKPAGANSNEEQAAAAEGHDEV